MEFSNDESQQESFAYLDHHLRHLLLKGRGGLKMMCENSMCLFYSALPLRIESKVQVE